jgi:chitinase
MEIRIGIGLKLACSFFLRSQPWLRSEAQRQVMTYDDPESMRLKGEMGRRTGILGVNMFAAHGDDGWALVDGARRGMGVVV